MLNNPKKAIVKYCKQSGFQINCLKRAKGTSSFILCVEIVKIKNHNLIIIDVDACKARNRQILFHARISN